MAKRRKVKRKRRPTAEALKHAEKMLGEWETKRRLADTKTRYWQQRARRYSDRLQVEFQIQQQRVEKLEREVLDRKRAISFAD